MLWNVLHLRDKCADIQLLILQKSLFSHKWREDEGNETNFEMNGTTNTILAVKKTVW